MEPHYWKYIIIGIIILAVLCLLYMYFFGEPKDKGEDRSAQIVFPEEVEEEQAVKDDNFIAISLPNHPQFIGSQIIVKTPNNTYIETHTTDRGTLLTIPIYDENIIEIVKVRTMYGDDIEYEYPEVNTTIIVDPRLDKLSEEINELRNRISDYDDLPDSTQGLKRRFDRIRY